MLFRFCLYGFLKNQRYFEPFLLLAFLEKGLSFAQIGLLIGFREICVNVMEVPTGAIADVLGRRRAMIASFVAYIVSFLIFGLSGGRWALAALFGAMFFFSIGEAFRTGTHKAMIFDWLAAQGRADEKTKVYGYTRSWSKLGSAVSVIIGPALVFALAAMAREGSGLDRHLFSYIFLFSILPYAANVVNFLGYPSALDGPRGGGRGVGTVFGVLWASLRDCLGVRPLRRLLAEGMTFSGTFAAVKDYAQPVIRTAALSLPFFLAFTGKQRTALLVGVVYLPLHLMCSYAARHSGRFKDLAGSEVRAARLLWVLNLGAFAVMLCGVGLNVSVVVILGFAIVTVLHDVWRPILVSRFAERAESAQMATVLSIESQAKSLFAAVLAPLLGWAVDLTARALGPAAGSRAFFPVGVAGLAIAATMLATGRSRRGASRVDGRGAAEPSE